MALASRNCSAVSVVATGYDYGAGLAAVFAATHGALSPKHISFRQPELLQSLDDACIRNVIDTSRWLRFQNTRVDRRLHIITLVYDDTDDNAILRGGFGGAFNAFSSLFFHSPRAKFAGHLLILAVNDKGVRAEVAWMGENSQQVYQPGDQTSLARQLVLDKTTPHCTPGFDPRYCPGHVRGLP